MMVFVVFFRGLVFIVQIISCVGGVVVVVVLLLLVSYCRELLVGQVKMGETLRIDARCDHIVVFMLKFNFYLLFLLKKAKSLLSSQLLRYY